MRIDLPCCDFKNCKYQFDGNCTDKGRYEKCEYIRFALNELPSAQTDVPETNVGDTISRQAAIDELCKMRCGCVLSSCPLTLDEDGAEECADVRLLMSLPSAQQDQSIIEWQKDFKGYVNQLCIPRDDYNGIMEYIDEVPYVGTKRSCGRITVRTAV